MTTGVGFRGPLNPKETKTFTVSRWPAAWYVYWFLMPTSYDGQPQINWTVAVERIDDSFCNYYITVVNLTSNPVTLEGRFVQFP